MKTDQNKVAQERRRAGALERQAAVRTPEAQLQYLDTKGFTATKERAKLAARIAKAAAKKN
jgi:hypothetical protein